MKFLNTLLSEAIARSSPSAALSAAAADVRGHRRVDERVHARVSQLGEHGRRVGGAVAQVAPGEGVVRAGEFALRRHAVGKVGARPMRATAFWPINPLV